MEKLVINNFLCIKHAEIILNDFVVFVGPNSSGKSLCAKLVYYFRSFAYDCFITLRKDFDTRSLKSLLKTSFLKIFYIDKLSDKDFIITYATDNFSISITLRKGKLDIDIDNSFIAIRNTIKKNLITNDTPLFSDNLVRDTGVFDLFVKRVGSRSSHMQIFVPSSRTIYTQLSDNIFLLFDNPKIVLDSLVKDFGQLLSFVTKNVYKEIQLNSDKSYDIEYKHIKIALKDIFGADLSYIDNKWLFIHEDGRIVLSTWGSSGQQEMLPLAIILQTLPFMRFRPYKGKTIYIEEPETHMFPTTQTKIIKLLVDMFNMDKLRFHFVVTTHSPYILTTLNNILLKVANENETNTTNLEGSNNRIMINSISVYMIDKGEAHDIYDRETGLIEAEIIDEVSIEILNEYNNILNEEK